MLAFAKHAFAGLCLQAALACTVHDPVASLVGADTDAGGWSDASSPRDQYCEGEGPPVLVGDGAGGTDICTGEIAEATFRFALCTCADYSGSNSLTIDSFDSSLGPFVSGQPGGSLGTNEHIEANGTITVGGDVIAAGALGISVAPTLDVGGNLADGGPLGTASATVTVAGDAQVAGDLSLAAMTVDGTLTVPAAAQIDVADSSGIPNLVRAPVSVAPPCACDPTDLLDVAGYVEAHRNANHNEDIGLDPTLLDDFTGEASLDLPCGLFFLDRIRGDGDLTITVDGRTALFVAQGIDLQAGMTVVVEPGGELDLFVSGNVVAWDAVTLGSAETPAKVRFYVGGAGSLSFSAPGTFGGNLYAPLVNVALSGGADVYGSMFVNRVASSAPLQVHYDRNVLDASDDCPEP